MIEEFIPSMIWLLFVSFSLGFALTREKNFMTIAFGLALFCTLSIAFNIIGIPLNWIVFLALSVAITIYFIYKKELNFQFTKPDWAIALVLLMAVINTWIFWTGATAYPYLEDDDPWSHAVGTKWISETGSYSRYFDGTNFSRLYIEPYPPSFDIVMGVLHQLTTSVTSTLKFYNAFLCGLSIIFAFYTITELTGNRRLGLFSAFFLLALPSFLSHFIWAQTLAMLFFFAAFYGFEKSIRDKRLIIPTGLAVGAIAITQPSAPAVFILFAGAYLLAKYYAEGKDVIKPIVFACVIGIAITAVYYVPVVLKYGPKYTSEGIGLFQGIFDPASKEDTSGGLVYGVSDYLFVLPYGKIDQHVGIGLVISLLALAGVYLFYKEISEGKKQPWMIFSLLWIAIGFLGTEGNALPFKLFPHRFWVFLSIPVAIIASYAYLAIEHRYQSYRIIVIALVLGGVLLTSALPKFQQQTSTWPPGASFYSAEELQGYEQMESSLPKNTLVFPLCSMDSKVIGSDMLSEPYVPEYEIFKRTAVNKTPEEVYSFISKRGYKYLIIDSTCINVLGLEEANNVLADYQSSEKYRNVYNTSGFFLLQVK